MRFNSITMWDYFVSSTFKMFYSHRVSNLVHDFMPDILMGSPQDNEKVDACL